MAARLSIFQVDHPVRQIVLQKERIYAVGREPTCAICIDDPEISRTHASLEYRGSGWTIRDNNSKNGTSVAGKSLPESPLRSDTWIGIGTLAIRFEELTPEQERRQTQIEKELRHQTLDGRRRMSAASDISRVLENLLRSTLSISGTERAFVMLTQADGDLRVVCSQSGEGKPFSHTEFIGSASAVQAALKTREPVVTCDASAHHRLASKASVVSAQTKALICLPLTLFGRTLGVIYADSHLPGKMFTDLDVKLLSELADHASLIVAAAQVDEQLDQVAGGDLDDQAASDKLRERVATVQHRIPDLGRLTAEYKLPAATGVSWSWIESQLGS